MSLTENTIQKQTRQQSLAENTTETDQTTEYRNRKYKSTKPKIISTVSSRQHPFKNTTQRGGGGVLKPPDTKVLKYKAYNSAIT